MKKLTIFFALCVALVTLSLTAFAQTTSWQKPYIGTDATGSDVLALWHFDGDGKDASGNGHNVTLRGKDTHFLKDGKFGGGLQIDSKVEPGDHSQGAVLKDTKALNPEGAFTLEVWFSPTADNIKYQRAFLLDKKNYYYFKDTHHANTGYMLLLLRSGKNQFQVQAHLGFGKDSAVISSMPQTFEAGKWYHIAFSYDGKGGYNFYLGNTNIGNGQLKDRAGISPSKYALVIGDRVGSLGHRFHGRIDEVRILNTANRFVSGKVLLDTKGGRTTFYRMEKDAKVQMQVFNDTLQPLKNVSVQIKAAGVFNKTISVPNLDAGKSTYVTVPLNASLRPDTYQVSAVVQNPQKEVISDKTQFPLTIVPRPLPHQTPIILWGNTSDYKALTDIGYTGEMVYSGVIDNGRIWENGDEKSSVKATTIDSTRDILDKMLAAGVNAQIKINTKSYPSKYRPKYNRSDKTGKRMEDIDGLYPRLQKFAHDVGTVAVRTFGDMPAWKGSLINDEIRGRSVPSYNEVDKKTYKEFSGQDIPQHIGGARGINYKSVPNFPNSRIIADDNPILTYYKWFWSKGNGWDQLNTAVSNGLKSTGRNIFTWAAPAVRVPSVWGSGGDVNFLNQWTYTYPNPITAGLATDELFAMAKGRPGQKVMNMIQIIWKRKQITDTPKKGHETEWEKATPDVKYMSIAPDHLSEGTWLEFSRPVKAIANHGWGSIGDHLGAAQGSYKTTNVGTRKRMTYLYQNVIKPLGPTMTQVPDYKTDVAFLESFASQMFAGRGTYGWGSGWGADSYMIARYAGLQPQIVYDQAIVQKGLGQYKILFLTNCDVLSKSEAEAIKKFQQNGGIVIGDAQLAPGIQPDILLDRVTRTTPDATKKLLIQKAQELIKKLQPVYRQPLQSSNPNVLTRLRQSGDSQYIFTVNDHRTYGDYVGQYKKVMEKGLPSQAQITLNTMPNGSVYDLMNHKQVATTRILGKVQFPVSLKGGEGDVFIVTKKPVGKLWVTAPTNAQRSKTSTLKVQLNNSAGAQMSAVVPMTVTISDSQGRVAEKSGYYGAANGRLEISLDIAPNDVTGKWKVEVTEALTGQKTTKTFEVR